MAPHSSTFAWKIPWTEEPGGLQSMGLLESDTTERLHFHFSLSCIGEGNGDPLQCSCLENPKDRGAWWAAVYGVAQSWTRLKRLSSSSIHIYIYVLFHSFLIFHFGLLHNFECSSLCYKIRLCCLSILYIIVCICLSQTPNPTLPCFPSTLVTEQVCSLCP